MFRTSGWKRTLVTVSLGYLVWAGMLFLMQRTMIFPGAGGGPTTAPSPLFDTRETLWEQGSDSKAEAWFLPASGATPDAPAPLVVFAHGNNEYIDDFRTLMASYHRMGMHVLMGEYRGYGRSTGTPSEQGIADDFEAFLSTVLDRPDVDGSRVVYHGRSLGGGVVCALSRRRAPAALVLQSTFVSIAEMARRYFLPAFLVRDPFDNIGYVSSSDVPVLIMHGTRDSMIPFSQAERLHNSAANGRLISYACDHNDCPPDSTVYWRDLEHFYRETGVLKTPVKPSAL